MQLRTPKFSRGMTLIELMVVVVIATILVSIAVPSYMAQVRRSRRVEAKTALLELAGREERFLSTNGADYSQTPAELGYAAFGVPIASGYYSLAVTRCQVGANCGPNAVPGPSYILTATPVAGTPQVNDTECGAYSVDSIGSQFSSGSQTAAYCWHN